MCIKLNVIYYVFIICLAQALKETTKITCEEYPDSLPTTNENCTFTSSFAIINPQISFTIIFIFVLPAHGLF